MKKRTKVTLGVFTLLLGAITLSGCTQSFCSVNDKAHMLYAYDRGISHYSNTGDPADKSSSFVNDVYVTKDLSKSSNLESVIKSAKEKGYAVPTDKYWYTFDQITFEKAVDAFIAAEIPNDFTIGINRDFHTYEFMGVTDYAGTIEYILEEFGCVRYSTGDTLWDSWDEINQEVKTRPGITIDDCPTSDFISLYKSTMETTVANNRACLTTKTDKYGSYGYGTTIKIEGKTWKYAWQKGLFEGLLVYPIGALIDWVAGWFGGTSVSNGIPQIMTILIVTVLVRSLMLLVTIKQSKTNAITQELQPEIQKIQAKYPNSNTNQYEKQRMAEEMQKLYKKNNINPLSSLLVLIVQFPVFICVWGAFQGSAILSTGSVLGLNMSTSISNALFQGDWANAASSGCITALVLFVLMSGAQAVSMLLPQWMQKKKAKGVAKLGKNPAQKDQNNKMKWFTYIMLVMIIVMGFSLPSAMGVYWLVGAMFSIGQTLIMQAITSRSMKKGGKK